MRITSFRLLMVITLLVAYLHAPVVAGQAAPGQKSYICNLAKVFHLKAGDYLSVYSGPSDQSSKIDQLTNDTVVYVCDEEEDWLKVSYGTRKSPCGPVAPTDGLNVRKATACKSGWVRREWVNIISG
jgi:hypothetical protein